jgi:ribosomal protein S18 acetylase RimI-like enzyme
MNLSYRPATGADRPLLLALYASTRAQELAQVPWPPEQKQAFVQMQFAAQTSHYEQHHPQSEHLIVLRAGEEAGRLWVDRGPAVIHILDLTVHPDLRGQGIGTAVLQGLLDEGAATGRPVTIHLEPWSPAVRLMNRLGFTKAAEQGYYHLHRWDPAAN